MIIFVPVRLGGRFLEVPQKQNENESESVILVFVLHHFDFQSFLGISCNKSHYVTSFKFLNKFDIPTCLNTL